MRSRRRSVSGRKAQRYLPWAPYPWNAKTKHNIKRADRLFSNENLQREGSEVYRQLALVSLRGNKRPIIPIDWSDIDARREFFLLRAAIAVKGRLVTVYEEVHTRATRDTRKTHAAFLNNLKEMLLEGTSPIIVTDAGWRGVLPHK